MEALRGAEMTIEEPGFYAVMGRSGSGKSTLLHLLAGLDRPESGEIIVGGTAVHSLGETDLVRYRRRGVGIVFQQFNLIPTLDALGNVMLPGLLDGMAERDVRERARALLHELNLADRSAHRPDTLSGGEQQRVAIARALLLDPPVVLADEPTGSLDSTTSAALWKLLEQTAQRRGGDRADGDARTGRRLVLPAHVHPPRRSRCGKSGKPWSRSLPVGTSLD